MKIRNFFILSVMALIVFGGIIGHTANGEYSGQFNYGQAKGKGKDWIQSIKVIKPAYRSKIKGTTKISFKAPGMEFAEAKCWHQPDEAHPGKWGYDAIVMPAKKIDGNQETTFEFPDDQFPHGPITIRIATKNSKGKRDICELQLYNQGGVKWNQGIPNSNPPAAKNLKLIFSDDFNKMPKISRFGIDATYMGHKPPNGSQDFSGWRFSHKDDYPGAHDPYEQMGTWLRIKARAKGADKKKWGSGIFAPVDIDYNGVTATPPFYMECRLTAQSAPGAWPAFWTLTIPNPDIKGCDELDVIEGYGGVGKGNPNDFVGYHCVSHFWGQKDVGKNIKAKGFKTHTRPPMMTLGGKSYWSTTFHTYGIYVDKKDTVYYFDDIEVLRHPSGPVSASTAAYFLVNYAIGGISGWKIDMKRYGNASDMWVDYVRVYGSKALKPKITPKNAFLFDKPVTVKIKSVVPGAKLHYSLDGSDPTASSPLYTGPLSIKKACTVKAIALDQGLEPSQVSTAKVENAWPAKTPVATDPGLVCNYYEGKWMKIPDFKALKPNSTTVETEIAFPKDRAKDHFALQFKGFINVPTSGLYTFFTNSDDGSQLLIDGHLVVNNDGAHGPQEQRGVAGLMKGKHEIEIRFFEASGGESLIVSWQGPGIKKQVIPASILTHTPGAIPKTVIQKKAEVQKD